MEANELAAKKTILLAVEAEIAERTLKFEDSIADLRRERERLRRDYADALRAELATVDNAPVNRPPLERILAAIESTKQPIIIERLREAAGKHLPSSVARRYRGTLEQ
jgi:hypothetical protein